MPRYFSLKNKLSLFTIATILVAGAFVCVGTFFYLNQFLLKIKFQEIKDKTIEKSVEMDGLLKNDLLFVKMLGTRDGMVTFLQSQLAEIEEGENSEIKNIEEEATSEEEQVEEEEKKWSGSHLQKVLDKYAEDNKKYLSIYLMDKEGNTLLSTDRSFIGKNYSFRDYFQKSINGYPAMDAVLGKTSNQFGFYFSHPVESESGEVLGVMVAKVDGKDIFRANVSETRLGMDNIFLTNDLGIIIGAIDESNLLKSMGDLSDQEKEIVTASKKFSNKEIESFGFNEVKSLLDRYKSPENVEVEKGDNIFSISRVPDSDYFIVSRVNRIRITESIYPIIFIIIMGIFGACILVALMVYLITRSSLSSLDKIKVFSEDLAGGDFSQKIIIKENNEIGDLAKAFNSLSQKLKGYYSELERKVAEKNSESEKNKDDLENQQKAILNILDDVEWEKKIASVERDKIDAILHSIGDGVFVVDAGKKITMVNHITEKISGFTKEELIGKIYNQKLKFIFEKDEKENKEFMDKALSTGTIQEMSNHTMLIKKDGEKVPVADSAAPLKNKEGEITGCVVVFRDVTKEREVDRMKTEFVSLASHQLRTPLTSIKWYAELLLTDEKNDKLAGDKRDFVQEIHGGNERMIELVNDLLNVSRIETGKKFTIEKKKNEIVPIIKKAIKEHEIVAQQKNIEIICEKKIDEKTALNVDKEKILQVFHNFISNAIKYSPEGKKIYVGCNEDDKQYVFHVKDEGEGIPKDQQNRIFEKFFRASNVLLTGAEGTGLGLYIAKSIIEGHGGKIWFESEENKGTTFFVSLPKKI